MSSKTLPEDSTDPATLEKVLAAQDTEISRRGATSAWIHDSMAASMSRTLANTGGSRKSLDERESIELTPISQQDDFDDNLEEVIGPSQRESEVDEASSENGQIYEERNTLENVLDVSDGETLRQDEIGEAAPKQSVEEEAEGSESETGEHPEKAVPEDESEEKSSKMSISPDPDYDESVKPQKLLGRTVSFKDEPQPDYGTSMKLRQLPSSIPETLATKGRDLTGALRVFPGTQEGSGLLGSTSPSQKVKDKTKNGLDPKRPPDELKDVEDLSRLQELNLEIISKCLKERFDLDRIYTHCGDILIAVNPFKELNIFTKKEQDDYSHTIPTNRPHLYCISARAYRGLREDHVDQVILISGESGAGKTRSNNYIVEHIVTMAGTEYDSLHWKLIKINNLLEAFGNAWTNLNENSSRFAKYLKLEINESTGQLHSARVRDYMLEKSRVVHHGPREHTFHSFYGLLCGADTQLLDELFLDRGRTYRVTGQFHPDQHQKYKKIFTAQREVLSLIGMDDMEVQEVYNILAAIMHIGDVDFEERDHDSVIIRNEDAVEKAAHLLDVDQEKLTTALIQRRGKLGKGEYIEFSKNKKQAEDERDALAKALYERLFGWLVRKVNLSLRPSSRQRCVSIGILDICGFEKLDSNSFEQLCINLVNEQLQNFMNAKVIEEEVKLYQDEGIDIGDVDPSSVNNDHILDMFMRGKDGVLSFIDESSKVEFFDDMKLVTKMANRFGGNGVFLPSSFGQMQFTIKHFAGKVTYDAENFILKNKDTLSDLMVESMTSNESCLVGHLFRAQEGNHGSISMSTYDFPDTRRPTSRRPRSLADHTNLGVNLGVSLSDTINKRTQDHLRSRFGDKPPEIWQSDMQKKTTHITFFRRSLSFLLEEMKRAEPYFVRCIKPNDDQRAGQFNKKRVQTQLEYTGITEVARIRTFGFPYRLTVQQFINRYRDLSSCPAEENEEKLCQSVLVSVGADTAQYRLGITQVLMKDEVRRELDLQLAALRQREEKERREAEERRKREERERKEAEERRKREERERKEAEERRKRELEGKKKKQTEEEERQKSAQETAAVVVGEPVQRHDILGGSRPHERHVDISQTWRPTLETIEQGASTQCSESDIYQSAGTYDSSNGPSGEDRTREANSNRRNETEEQGSVNSPGSAASQETSESWDIFSSLEEEEERPDVHEQPVLMALKLVVFVLLFLLVLVSLVCHKVSLMVLIGSLDVNISSVNFTGRKREKEDAETLSYVYLMITMCIPLGFSFLVSVAKVCFGSCKAPNIWTWIWVLMMESLHTVGLVLLVFRVLPLLDSVRGVMLLSATALAPSLLKLTTAGLKTLRTTTKTVRRTLLDLLTLCVQASVIPLVVLFDFIPEKDTKPSEKHYWDRPDDFIELIGALVLVSFGYWENFIDSRLLCFDFTRTKYIWLNNAVLKTRYELQRGRHYIYMLAFLVKITLTIVMAVSLKGSTSFDYEAAFDKMSQQYETLTTISAIIAVTCSAFLAFFFALAACSFDMQVFSLAIPILLASPLAGGVLYMDCHYHFLKEVTTLPVKCPSPSTALTSNEWYHLVFGIVWWLSFLVLTRHIWMPTVEPTANMDRLFISPTYCGIMCTESIALHRRRQHRSIVKRAIYRPNGKVGAVRYELVGQQEIRPEDKEDGEDPGPSRQEKTKEEPVVPMLYACATMWHETRREMLMLLKSLHRIDKDQYIRKCANDKIGEIHRDSYNYEAHIFFDDAMEKNKDKRCVVNDWVKELVSCMAEACSSVHGQQMKIHAPHKISTPYGGQLVWQMPGGNLLYVHIKDMGRIRNRKRWSQVMYMYYLLGYRLLMSAKDATKKELQKENQRGGYRGLSMQMMNSILDSKMMIKAEKTFLLALDGDTDFTPGSVKILKDRMDDPKVGAACGRIHPIGAGPMIWYQKFEYAVGHWLQKAAEHVFGCVLCSPGCFSLFRASALMDTNVMNRYTTEPTEPTHHLQFDQGEDRWLCTLLLQQGYRIEYDAAADAWTYAPEGFFEFYNQRRRWMPSTIANILDLLNTASRTTRLNPNISLPYIIYQWLLMLMTILGPGTVLMMIAGAVRLVFSMDLVEAYLFATLPAAIFVVVCFWCKQNVQLGFAAILSVVYAFIMMVVFVGTLYTATTEDIFHPSVLVILLLVFIFSFAAACHPKEWACLIHGVLYMMVIPSGYLLLVIYSIINLNDVSWGTRMVPTKEEKEENERRKREQEEQKELKKQKSVFARWFGKGEEHLSQLTNLIKTIVPDRGSGQSVNQLGLGTAGNDPKLVTVLNKIERNTRRLLKRRDSGSSSDDEDPALKEVVCSQPTSPENQQSVTNEAPGTTPESKEAQPDAAKEEQRKKEEERKKIEQRKKEAEEARLRALEEHHPIWVYEPTLGSQKYVRAVDEEWTFWVTFVQKYLAPIRPTKEEKKETETKLRDLRNSSSFGFIIVNCLWMALNFMFQYTNAAKITLGGGTRYETEESALGLSFVAALLVLMVLQLIGMVIHRLGTLRHLLAITIIRFRKPKEDELFNDKHEEFIKHAEDVLRLPLANDPGACTEPPRVATETEANQLGLTVIGSGSIRQGLESENAQNNFARTMRAVDEFGTVLDARRTHGTRLDMTTQGRYTSVRQRLTGDTVAEQLGTSQRPQLPKRPARTPSARRLPFKSSHNFGFTHREFEEIAGTHINNAQLEEDEDQVVLRNLEPLGRSLFRRGQIIDGVQRTSPGEEVNWNPGDIWNNSMPPSNHIVHL